MMINYNNHMGKKIIDIPFKDERFILSMGRQFNMISFEYYVNLSLATFSSKGIHILMNVCNFFLKIIHIQYCI